MGLINNKTKVKWGTRNKKYYESKGYLYTKIGGIFDVKVNDLPINSEIIVQVKCDGDNCNKISNVSWKNYIKNFHKYNGKYYCVKCSAILNKEKGKQTHLKNSTSFYDWCYKNLDKKQADEIMNRWDYDKNKCSPKEITYASEGFNKKGYYFKCLKHKEHKSELKYINSFTKGRFGSLDCKQCNSFAQYLIDTYGNNALDLYWSDKNIINPWNISYGSCSKKIFIKCQNKECNHEDYKTTCNGFSRGNNCPKCSIINKTGKNSPKWKGGTTTLNKYLRDEIKQWKKDSMKKYNYQYILTGEKRGQVHHLYGLDLIIKEIFQELNLPIYSEINKYKESELELITEKCLELHYKHGLGVYLSKEIHGLFHSIYGLGNNIPEQFDEFIVNYKKGMYTNSLKKVI